MTDELHYSKDGAVATIRFNRPQKKNALTNAMYAACTDALEDARMDETVRVACILGGDVFTAGNDVGDFLAARGSGEEMSAVPFLHAISRFPKPLLAGVRGLAIGIGTTLLMHCDAVVAGKSARFMMPFTKLGLVPEAGSSALFPLIAGQSRASWYLLSGEGFGADEALDFGLVTRVTDDDEVDGAISLMCGQLADLPVNAVANTKRLVKGRIAELVAHAIREELHEFERALKSDEARAAFVQFMQRS